MKNHEKELLYAEQISFIFNIDESTVKKLAKQGDLPCKFINRQPRFDLDVLFRHFELLEGEIA